jgi:hypothetical protein
MSKARGSGPQVDQIVKLLVGAGQASPSPPVGPALGSRGVKSMDFCKVRDLSRATGFGPNNEDNRACNDKELNFLIIFLGIQCEDGAH